jgi:hypothetical protein
MIKGKRVYGSFEKAKASVLARREELRTAWELKKGLPVGQTPKSSLRPTGTGEMGTRKPLPKVATLLRR